MVEVSPNQEWGDYNAFSSMGDAQRLLLSDQKGQSRFVRFRCS
jgi:hypothetical protein